MENKFTNEERRILANVLGEAWFKVEFNRVGNLNIICLPIDPYGGVHFAFNRQPNGKIIIRRYDGWYCHPIGTKWINRKYYHGGYSKGGWESKTMDWSQMGFTFEEAVSYFVKYVAKFIKHEIAA